MVNGLKLCGFNHDYRSFSQGKTSFSPVNKTYDREKLRWLPDNQSLLERHGIFLQICFSEGKQRTGVPVPVKDFSAFTIKRRPPVVTALGVVDGRKPVGHEVAAYAIAGEP